MQNKLHILLAILLISIMAAPNGAFAYSESHDDHQHIQSSFQNTTRAAEIPAWITRSNENARVLLAVQARFSPKQPSTNFGILFVTAI